MPTDKAGKSKPDVVVVTGASAGVGRATAIAFARQGARLGLLARDADRLEAARQEVEAAGGTAIAVPTDVADTDQVEAAAARVERELGPIDIWVNNAMATVFAPFEKISPAEFKRATEVTYLGVVYGTMAAFKRMRARNRGTVVQVGSALAYRSIPLQAPYCGAKHAILGLTDSLRSELIHDRSDVHLTMVQLCACNTPQFEWARSRLPKQPQPVPPIYQPEVAAQGIVWAAHHRRREVWVGGSTFQAILGQRVWPGFMDWLMARLAYEGQMTDDPAPPDRPGNLFEPVPGTFATHGRFDKRARERSWLLWLITDGWLVLVSAAVLLVIVVILVIWALV